MSLVNIMVGNLFLSLVKPTKDKWMATSHVNQRFYLQVYFGSAGMVPLRLL